MRNDTEHVIIAWREKMERQNLSLRQCSELCGVSFSTLSRIGRGACPSLPVLERLDSWAHGSSLPKKKPITHKRIKCGAKTFILTLEEI